MTSDHIVKSYDEELNRLENAIATMGGLAEAQLADAVQALIRRNAEDAQRIKAEDRRIDEMESQINEHVVRLLALRQPMAVDLRVIMSAFKITGDLERIGDLAKNIAKRTIALSEAPPGPAAHSILRLSHLVQAMIKDVLDAYIGRDPAKAEDVWARDEEVDALHTSLFRELLTYMMEDARNITTCTHLLFIAKNLERVGDHATNIAETVHFMVEGRLPEHDRAKQDAASYTVVDAGGASDAREDG